MKKLAILSTIALFALFFVQTHAQQISEATKKNGLKTELKTDLKTDIKKEKEAIKNDKTNHDINDKIAEKEAIRNDRKELHQLENGAVSDLSKDAFYADFGNVQDVKWERTVYYDEATFMNNGVETKAYYDDKSQLVGTSAFKTFADIPKAAQKEIMKKYKDYTIGEVVFFDDNEANDSDMLLYGTQFNDADNYFVTLTKNNKKIILQVNPEGNIFFFKEIKEPQVSL